MRYRINKKKLVDNYIYDIFISEFGHRKIFYFEPEHIQNGGVNVNRSTGKSVRTHLNARPIFISYFDIDFDCLAFWEKL